VASRAAALASMVPMKGFEGFDALINHVVNGAERKTSALKIRTFANNFANINNIGDEIKVREAAPRPSPSPSPPPVHRKRGADRPRSRSPAQKRPKSSVETASSKGGSAGQNTHTSIPSTLPFNGEHSGRNEQNHAQKVKHLFSKSFLFLPHDVHIKPNEKKDVIFEIPELSEVESEVEVKVISYHIISYPTLQISFPSVCLSVCPCVRVSGEKKFSMLERR
jgi:hypothetical protein